MTGGITFTNAREHRDQSNSEFYSNNLCFIGATRGFLGGISTEGATDYGIQFGLEDSGVGPGDAMGSTFIAGSSAFESLNIQTSCGDVIIHTFRETKIRKEAPAILFFLTHSNVRYEDGVDHWLPHEITHVNPTGDEGTYRVGGNRDSPPTPLGLQIQTSPPPYPEEASFAVADGTNWDPLGNGNAALVAYDTDDTWKPIFEYSGKL
jgi:hypothetical protein